MDLTIKADQVSVIGQRYSQIEVEITGLDEKSINNAEVANEIDFDVFISAKGEREVLEYLQQYYPELFK